MNYVKMLEILDDHSIVYLQNSTHIILKICPNCGGKDKIMIDKRNLLWQCWKCKGDELEETAKGNAYTLLTKVLQLDKISAMNLMKGSEVLNYTQDTFKSLEEKEIKKEIVFEKTLEEVSLPSNWILLDCSASQIQSHKEPYKYLLTRFIHTQNQISSYRLRYDVMNKRIIFPVYVDKGIIVGYQGRDITNRWKDDHPKCVNFSCKLFRKFYFKGEMSAPEKCPECGGPIEETFYPKSINSKNFPKSDLFFNQQNVDWSKPVTIVEGPFDSINTPNSIGLLGRTISEQQVLNIIKITQSINNLSLILYLDGDAAGTSSTIEVYSKLSWLVNSIKIVYLEDGDDPGAHSLEENSLRIKKAIDFSSWCGMKKIPMK